MDWEQVDVGWGRRATVFATQSEPSNVREYVAIHQRLDVSAADRVLDLACGAGLALELAAIRGARVSGIDAAARLVAIARDRVPSGDIRTGDMNALPWADASFDVVTSFRGIWGTTPGALSEAHRVLRPGGRLGITVWGHLKTSPGGWALSPFRLAAEAQVAHMADMVSLGRPGVGEQALADAGFVDIRRVAIPFVWEFTDPVGYARALASTGPAYEAIETVGEEAFLAHARDVAQSRVRDGLPLRAEIAVTAFLGTRGPVAARGGDNGGRVEPTACFLSPAAATPAAQGLYDDDVEAMGFVMNASRLWAHQPETIDALFELMGRTRDSAGLTTRDRGILTVAMAATLGDSYCSLAWGGKLAASSDDPSLVAGVLIGDDSQLDERERALASWARAMTSDPNRTTTTDVEGLRSVGYDDSQILALTAFVALRLAFSVVNDALGARPDAELLTSVPDAVAAAVSWGRPPSTASAD